MIVVSDTSPVGSLFLISRLDLLPAVFGKVIIPRKVLEELTVLETDFGHDLAQVKTAAWLEIRVPGDSQAVQYLQKSLDQGESEAIVLAQELKADFVLIDESEGRKIAQEAGLRVIGLLGILIQAKRMGLIERVKPILDELSKKAAFRIAKALYEEVLRQVDED